MVDVNAQASIYHKVNQNRRGRYWNIFSWRHWQSSYIISLSG